MTDNVIKYKHTFRYCIHFVFVFQSENFSNWVIGPELGKFIAGLRNDDNSICVHSLNAKWKYASRAGVWKQDDNTLDVKCYSPEDDLNSNLSFGTKKTTTALPVTFGLNTDQNPEDRYLLYLPKHSIIFKTLSALTCV